MGLWALRLPAGPSLGVGPGSGGRSVRQFWEMTRHCLHRQSIHSQEMLGQLLQEVCVWCPCLAWLSCPVCWVGWGLIPSPPPISLAASGLCDKWCCDTLIKSHRSPGSWAVSFSGGVWKDGGRGGQRTGPNHTFSPCRSPSWQ